MSESNEPKKSTNAVFFFIAIVLIFMGMTSGDSQKATPASIAVEKERAPQRTFNNIVTRTAAEITREYDGNEVRANLNYNGKFIKVTGTVDSIDVGTFGGYRLSLKGPMFKQVVGYFPDENAQALANLNKGDAVEIIGMCDGKTLGSVCLSECTLAGN